jgi:hypothetical protein
MTERSAFRAIEPHDAFTILLVAPSPPEHKTDQEGRREHAGIASMTGRLDAVLSVARAAFAIGGRVVMPGDRGMSPLVAATALDYAPQRATERTTAAHVPLVVVDTQESDRTLADLLAPYVMRGAVLHVGPNGEPPSLDGWNERESDRSRRPRQPVTPRMLDAWPPDGAVFVAPELHAETEAQLLADRGIPLAAIAHADGRHARHWESRDPLVGIVNERRSVRTERDASSGTQPEADEAQPFAFAAQLLVHLWTNRS